jgi:hypothetical protein
MTVPKKTAATKKTVKKTTVKKTSPKKKVSAKKATMLSKPVVRTRGTGPLSSLPPGTPMTEALGESFLSDLITDWQDSGVNVIEECRTNKPDAYLRLISAYAPKEFRKQIQPFEEMSDEELERKLADALLELKALGFDPSTGTGT